MNVRNCSFLRLTQRPRAAELNKQRRSHSAPNFLFSSAPLRLCVNVLFSLRGSLFPDAPAFVGGGEFFEEAAPGLAQSL